MCIRYSFADALAEVDELSDRAKELMKQATGLLQTVSAEISPVLNGLERMLSEKNAANVSELLENMNHTVAQSGPRLSKLMERLNGLVAQIESGLVKLPELTQGFGELIEDLRAALGPESSLPSVWS